jgi:hypothetical protein
MIASLGVCHCDSQLAPPERAIGATRISLRLGATTDPGICGDPTVQPLQQIVVDMDLKAKADLERSGGATPSG